MTWQTELALRLLEGELDEPTAQRLWLAKRVNERPPQRTWVTVLGPEGFYLRHRNQVGQVGVVPPHNPMGDTLEQVRKYVAEEAKPCDLYFEIDRIYWVLPGVSE